MPKTRRDFSFLLRLLVVGIFIALFAWNLRFVHLSTVNIFFWDQWDFLQPLFKDQGLLAEFSYQHGPHREGLGLPLMKMLLVQSFWNSRWLSFAAAGCMILSSCLAARLAARFGLRGSALLLVAFPLIYLNCHQYESFIGAVNLSHGVLPNLLIILYCWSLFVVSPVWRNLYLSALTFLLVFTGFGLFMGVVTLLLAIIESVYALRKQDFRLLKHSLALGILTIGIWLLFSYKYTFQPAVSGFRFPYEIPSEYFAFVAKMLANFYGAPLSRPVQLAIGFPVLAALSIMPVWHGIKCLRHGVFSSPKSAVILSLSTFALLFGFNCAVGRVFTGETAPVAPRYVTLLAPAAVVLVFQFVEFWNHRRFKFLIWLYLAALVPATLVMRPDEASSVSWYVNGLSSWKKSYVANHDQKLADKSANFSVYPGDIQDRLNFLEERRFNIFSPVPPKD